MELHSRNGQTFGNSENNQHFYKPFQNASVRFFYVIPISAHKYIGIIKYSLTLFFRSGTWLKEMSVAIIMRLVQLQLDSTSITMMTCIQRFDQICCPFCLITEQIILNLRISHLSMCVLYIIFTVNTTY